MGGNSQLIIIIAALSLSFLSWAYQKVRENQELKRAREAARRRYEEQLRTGREDEPSTVASSGTSPSLEELAARRQAQLQELRRQQQERARTQGASAGRNVGVRMGGGVNAPGQPGAPAGAGRPGTPSGGAARPGMPVPATKRGTPQQRPARPASAEPRPYEDPNTALFRRMKEKGEAELKERDRQRRDSERREEEKRKATEASRVLIAQADAARRVEPVARPASVARGMRPMDMADLRRLILAKEVFGEPMAFRDSAYDPFAH